MGKGTASGAQKRLICNKQPAPLDPSDDAH
jgi:hypothetical protein